MCCHILSSQSVIGSAIAKEFWPIPKANRKPIKTKKKTQKNYVVVSNSSHGKALKSQRIYFEGKKPTRLGVGNWRSAAALRDWQD
jgi:hypothetical protein